MNDRMLSQDEIEALIASLASDGGEAPAESRASTPVINKAVKDYDFRFPDKFSREHMRTFQVLYGQFARNFGATLSAYLRTSVQVRATLIEQMTYDEYMRSLANPTLIYIVGMAPLSGQTVVEINLSIARAVLDRLLGSSGLLSPRQMEMTEIELGLLGRIGELLQGSLKESWHNVLDLDVSMQEPVFAPDFVQVTLPGESTVMVVLEVSMLAVTGTMSMCLPHPMLAPIMDKLSAQAWFAGAATAATGDKSLELEEPIGDVTMPVIVELGRTELTVQDLLNLHEGQVIRLNTSANGDLPIEVGRSVKFDGRPGLLGKNLAVEITNARE